MAGMLNERPRDYLKVIGEVIDLRSEGIRNLSGASFWSRVAMNHHCSRTPGIMLFAVYWPDPESTR